MVSITVEPREQSVWLSRGQRYHNAPAIVVCFANCVSFFWVIWLLNRLLNSAIRASSFSFAVGILRCTIKVVSTLKKC